MIKIIDKKQKNDDSLYYMLHDIEKYISLHKQYYNLSEIIGPVLNYTRNISHKSLDELMNISTTVIAEIINKFTYSTLEYFFLDEIIEDHDDILSKSNTGNCVSIARKIIKELREHEINATIIPATLPEEFIQPGYPTYGHVATLIETPEYFVIFEPGYFISNPILVKKTGAPQKVKVDMFHTTWIFSYDQPQNKIYVIENPANTTAYNNVKTVFYYAISAIENPSQSITYPINIHNNILSIIKYNKNGRFYILIRIDRKQLQARKSSGEWYDIFDCKKCLDTKLSIKKQLRVLSSWEGFSQEHCRDLNIDRKTVILSVFSVIKNRMI